MELRYCDCRMNRADTLQQDADVLSGPGVMITCVKNKERSAIQEAERIFSEVTSLAPVALTLGRQ